MKKKPKQRHGTRKKVIRYLLISNLRNILKEKALNPLQPQNPDSSKLRKKIPLTLATDYLVENDASPSSSYADLAFYQICNKKKTTFIILNPDEKKPVLKKIEFTAANKKYPLIPIIFSGLQKSHFEALKSEFDFDCATFVSKMVTQQDRNLIDSHITSNFNKFAATFYIVVGTFLASNVTTFSLAKVGLISVTTACSLIIPVTLGLAAVFTLVVISYRFYKSSQKHKLSISPQTIFNNRKEAETHANNRNVPHQCKRAVKDSPVMRAP